MGIESLLRLRRQEMSEAERNFGVMQALEADAAALVTQAEQQLVQEQVAASDPAADDAVVEAFAIWLPVGRRALKLARERERAAALDKSYARSALILAQAAVRAVETVVEERAQSEMKAATRHEQAMLDDMWRPCDESRL